MTEEVNLFAPLPPKRLKVSRTPATLKEKFLKLDKFLDIPLDAADRENQKLDLLDESEDIDPPGHLTLVTKSNLTEPQDVNAMERFFDYAKPIEYFLLTFIAVKLNQEGLLIRVKNYFEESFLLSGAKPSVDILNRSVLVENIERFEAMPIRYRNYLIDIFLNAGASLTQEKRLSSGLEEINKGYFSETLPLLLRGINLMEEMDGDSCPEVLNDLMNSCRVNHIEREICEIMSDLYKWTRIRKITRLLNILNPISKKAAVHELILLFIITHNKYQWLLKIDNMMEHVKKQLKSYLKRRFACDVPESSTSSLINRSYYVQNRKTIEMLPEEAQEFIQNCLITALTKGHTGYEGVCPVTEGFCFNSPREYDNREYDDQ